uniref:Uncharacterized protein n=1 Tax=Arundo donax TaxID=35708 RepID=A0A0A8Z5F6_ARUDO
MATGISKSQSIGIPIMHTVHHFPNATGDPLSCQTLAAYQRTIRADSNH